MKKVNLLKSGIVLLITVLIFSCDNGGDPLPISKAGFDIVNDGKLERNIPVKFVNLSTNSATYKWDFGDGTSDSTSISPEHIYTESGSFDVTLTATTEDGQTSSETQDIDIKTRVLVAFTVANISFVDADGNPWDDDGTGPDLVFIFGAQSADLEDFIFTDTTKNLMPADLPIDWDFPEGSGMELTSELYDLVLLDTDPEKPEDPKYDVMFGIELDPVLYEFGVKDDEDNGLLQISIGGFAIDLWLTFELK